MPLIPGKWTVSVTWLAPCGRQVADAGPESRNQHLSTCRGCAEAWVEKQRRDAEEAERLGIRRAPLAARDTKFRAADGTVLADWSARPE